MKMLLPHNTVLFYFLCDGLEFGQKFISHWRHGFLMCDLEIPVLWGTSAGVLAGAWAPGGICMPV